MIQRGGDVVIRMLENVQQVTIKPLIQATIAAGTCIYTDESIPSPKLVNLQGLLEVYRVVVCHNDNAKPPGSPLWTLEHFCTASTPL